MNVKCFFAKLQRVPGLRVHHCSNKPGNQPKQPFGRTDVECRIFPIFVIEINYTFATSYKIKIFTMNIPKRHQVVMPYLMLNGAIKFIDFTKAVFNAEVNMAMHKLRDGGDKLMHSEITIGDSTIMFTDATEEWKPQTANLFVYVDNADETYAKALSAGAISLMELSNQDYGRTCGVTDPFGNVWWITSVNV